MANKKNKVQKGDKKVPIKSHKPNVYVAPKKVTPVIEIENSVVVVKKKYTSPKRNAITLRVVSSSKSGNSFDGIGVLTGSNTKIRFFDSQTGGKEIRFNNNDNKFTGKQLLNGIRLYVEGVKPSEAVKDLELILTLKPKTQPVGPAAKVKLTSVELFLKICKTRISAASDPVPLSEDDKIKIGRFVHVQDNGNHHGRAMIMVHKAKPETYTGELVLTSINNCVQIFQDEVAATGQAALANPYTIANSSIPANGTKLWAQGATVSGALRDTGFKLGIKDVENDGDRVVMTVVRLRRLSADPIHSTPPNRSRMGNWPAAHRKHFLRRGMGAAPDPNNYEVDFAGNRPLVLIENSVLATKPIGFSVQAEPVGVPVSWSIIRDTRPAPDGDHPDIIALSPNPVPTLTPNGADPLKSTLLADAVGSFHIIPYVDCNGNNQFDFNDPATGNRIDREPFIIMNLVLVRVTLHGDNSIARSANLTAAGVGGGINVSGGAFNINAPNTAAIHLNARANVVGGGNDGRRGVDKVFAGWINSESANEDIAGTFQDTTVVPPANHRSFSIFASNRATATGGGVASPIFLPGDPAPALVAPPLLDSGRLNAGTGGDTACLTTSRIRSRSNRPIGQRFRVEAVDSPGDGEGATHPGFPAANLVRFRFRLYFRAYLCFWTNVSRNSGATIHAGCRLYCVLRQIKWRMRGEWSVTPATGAIAVVTAPRVQITSRNTFAPIASAESTSVEVRHPTGLRLLARDARA